MVHERSAYALLSCVVHRVHRAVEVVDHLLPVPALSSAWREETRVSLWPDAQRHQAERTLPKHTVTSLQYLPSEVCPHPLTRTILPSIFWFFNDRGGNAMGLIVSVRQEIV